MEMAPRHFFLPLVAVLLISPALDAAAAGSLEQEYQQVRKIALRDPKVRAAYDEADRKLDAKILQIDPALADYLHHRSTPTAETASTEPKPAAHSKPVSVPEGSGATHTVKKGETLGAIAAHYGVTVAELKTTNHIVDEKKLAVGQVLNIPPR
jgi:nucleoid-associated protein YgaU